MRRLVPLLVIIVFLASLTLFPEEGEATAPTGWTEYNEPGAASNTWLQPTSNSVTFAGDGSGSNTFSYLISDDTELVDFRFTGYLTGLTDGTNTIVGITARWASVNDHTSFYIFETGVARIIRADGGGDTVQHEVAVTWQDNYNYYLDLQVFNDTMVATLTAPSGTHVLAASIPSSQLGNTELGLIAYPIFDEGEASWSQISFTSYTNPKDVLVEDQTEHNAFASGFYDGSDIHVIYRNSPANQHNIDTTARLMEVTSSDEGETWSAPSVWLDVAVQDEREPTFLRLQNDTIFGSLRLSNTTTSQTYVYWSTDDGSSWSSLVDIGNFLGETEEALAGYPIQIRNGTILLTLYDTGFAPILPSWVIWSDDMISWSVLGQLDSVSGIPSEWTIAELRNETLWADIRGPSSAWWYSFSTDNGTTWEPIRIQNNISQFYDGVNAFPAFLQLASGNIFVGHRAQLEGTSAGVRSRVNLGLLNPNPVYDSEVWFVLDAYDRVGEGHPDDYGYPDIIRISDGRYYFIWYDNSTSSIEGRLVVEPDLAPRQVTGVWTGVQNTIGIEAFTQYNQTVYTGFEQTNISAITTGAFVNISVSIWAPGISEGFVAIFDAEALSGTVIFTISDLKGARYYGLSVDGTFFTDIQTSPLGVLSFTWDNWTAAVNFTLEVSFPDLSERFLQQYGPSWAALLVGLLVITLIVGSFYTSIKRRKKSGKIWKFMPKLWRGK